MSSAYRGPAGGPRDPATAGGYCLTRCYCGGCPQFAAQRATVDLLRTQELAAEDRKQGERLARQARHRPRRDEDAA